MVETPSTGIAVTMPARCTVRGPSGASSARARWGQRELISAIFEWIEGWYNPRRRHTSITDRSLVDYERARQAAVDAA